MSTTIQPANILAKVSPPIRSSLLLYTQRERGLSFPQLAFQLPPADPVNSKSDPRDHLEATGGVE